jgi:hypothetical protein
MCSAFGSRYVTGEVLVKLGRTATLPVAMPIDYDIDAGVIVVRMHGQVASAEFASYLAVSSADPRYRSDMPRLVVIDDDTSFPPSREIIEFAGKSSQRMLTPDVRFACVARTPLAVGIASMYMGHAGLGDKYQVFADEQSAREWLAARAP